MTSSTESTWAVVATVGWLQEALVIRSLLESAGLDVQIPEEHMAAIHPLTTALHVRVMVRAPDLATAQQLLDASSLEPAPPEAE